MGEASRGSEDIHLRAKLGQVSAAVAFVSQILGVLPVQLVAIWP
jgi:hypothetical protein